MNWITPYHLGQEDRHHTRALHMALVRELYQSNRIPIVILLLSMGLLFGILKQVMVTSVWVRILYVSLVGVLVLRTLLNIQGDQLHGRNHRLARRYFLFFMGTLLTGLHLGALALLSFSALDPGHFILLGLFFMGVSSIAAVSLAGSPWCLASVAVPVLGSLALGGLLHPLLGLGLLFPATILTGLLAILYMSRYVHYSLCRNVLLGKRLGDLALRDPLTGLRNRRYLQEFMHEETPRVLRRWLETDSEVRNKRSISIIMVDLDLFKRVNDEHGHAAGDAVLVQVAQLLRDVVRKPDLVLRWGGEEFLVLALDSDRTAPPLIAVRVHERMAQHRFILPGGQTYQQTCSVGFAIFPFHPQRPDGLLWEQVFGMADQSLYMAKGSGRNCIHGILPSEADPDAIIEAMNQVEPDFQTSADEGLIRFI